MDRNEFVVKNDKKEVICMTSPSTSHNVNGLHRFGGTPIQQYMHILRFLTDGTLPWFESYEERQRFQNTAYSLKDGQIVHDGKFVLLQVEAEKVLREIHHKTEHGGASMMRKLVQDQFTYLEGSGCLEKDVNKIVEQCPACSYNRWLGGPKEASKELQLSVKVVDDSTRRFDITVTNCYSNLAVSSCDSQITKRPFGGLPPSEYEEIVHFVKTGHRPTFDKPCHSWSFKKHEFSFSLNEQGLLLRNGRYVLQDWESEQILRELHVNAGHPKASTIRRLGNTFTYAGSRSHFTEDLWRVAEECEDCRVYGAPLFKKDSPRWKDISCSVTRIEDGPRRLKVTIHGMDPKELEEHNRFLQKQQPRKTPSSRTKRKRHSIERCTPGNSFQGSLTDVSTEKQKRTEQTRNSDEISEFLSRDKENRQDENASTYNKTQATDYVDPDSSEDTRGFYESVSETSESLLKTSSPEFSTAVQCSSIVKEEMLFTVGADERSDEMPDIIRPDYRLIDDVSTSSAHHHHYVCTPLGNIQCRQGYVPGTPSFRTQQKIAEDGNGTLIIHAFMVRQNSDYPIVNTSVGTDGDDFDCFIMTAYGKIKVPTGFRCLNFGTMELEERNSLTVEIHLQLQKLQHS